MQSSFNLSTVEICEMLSTIMVRELLLLAMFWHLPTLKSPQLTHVLPFLAHRHLTHLPLLVHACRNSSLNLGSTGWLLKRTPKVRKDTEESLKVNHRESHPNLGYEITGAIFTSIQWCIQRQCTHMHANLVRDITRCRDDKYVSKVS